MMAIVAGFRSSGNSFDRRRGTVLTGNPAQPTVQLDNSRRALLARHAAWWQRKGTLYVEPSHAPLGKLWLPLAGGKTATEDLDLLPHMLDQERILGPSLEPGPLEVIGDVICVRQVYGTVPWMEAILGCPIRATIQGGSMRTRSFVKDWAEWDSRTPRKNADWLKALLQLTEGLVARSGGRYAVAQTLMRGPSDLAEAVLGPELMCLSMYDHPCALQRFLEEVTEAFIEVLQAQLSRIPPIEGGYVNPFGVWAPGTVVRTQCDASAFLSPAQYANWFLPYDARICEAVDYGIIHLHSGSLHTVDALLSVERPQAIQVTLDPESSAPPVEELLPIFRQVLRVKPLIVDGPLTREQVQLLRDELPPDGLYISARQGSW